MINEALTKFQSTIDSEQATEVLGELVFARPDITGAVLATIDGRVVASDIPDRFDDRQAAAILASTFGLGQRLTDFVGDAAMSEIVARSADGLVCVQAVGQRGALLVLAKPEVNLGLLQLNARRAADVLAPLLDHPSPIE